MPIQGSFLLLSLKCTVNACAEFKELSLPPSENS